MEKYIYGQESFHTSRWSGGSTVETAIFPADAQYLERDFIWRLSSAVVETEESSFTRLPDYDRILVVLEGETVLAHEQVRSAALKAGEQDRFDGAVKTRCFGTMRDYNLMFRKGCQGALRLIAAEKEARMAERSHRGTFTHASCGFYCTQGYLIVSVNGESDMLREGCQMVVNFDAYEDGDISIMGEGRGIMAEVLYDKERYVPEKIPAAKATAGDFKTAFRLLHSRNKWSQVYRRRFPAGVWYDEALQEKLNLLDRTYVTFFLWILGILLLAILTMVGLSIRGALILMLIWSGIHFLVIAPLIYTLVLPKPIAAHIKNAEELTEYERKLYEAQLRENGRVEKIMKKYRSSDENDEGESYRAKLRKLWK